MIDYFGTKFQKAKHQINSILPKPEITKNSIYVILIAALSLVCIRYLKTFADFLAFLEFLQLTTWKESLIQFRSEIHDYQLFDLCYWALCRFFFYLVIPILFIKLLLKKKLSDFGWRRSGDFNKTIKIFFLFFAFMLPLVYMVSTQSSFLNKYPFYHPISQEYLWPNLVLWEILYFIQFVALEFFFRGFIVHGFKKEIGDYSVLIMVIPYCMIHFQKPFLETIGAIFAGFILGYLSLRKNSIGTGIALHFSIAISIDIFALYHQGMI